jgi:arylsulfatase A-like enzyme
MQFTDAHSSSTVCTPTRYSIMTGDLPYRRGVFTGVGGPCRIEPDRLTLPGMLQDAGYTTALIGKWHLGMTFYDEQGEPINQNGFKPVRRVDWDRAITGGPVDRGFDYFFGTACCPTTDWLYAYIENDAVPVPPTKRLDQSHLPNHPWSHDNRRGMIAPNYDLERVDLKFLEKSQKFIRKQVQQKPDEPFFLFHSMQAVHLPSFPADEFKGKTDAGAHGDFIYEMDYIVGQLMKTLEAQGIADNTLVIFASDNGPELPTVIAMRSRFNHDGARPWRGVKRDNWEGGHRTPFIVRWPGEVEPGTTTDQLAATTDIMATCAEIADQPLPNNAAENSFNLLPILRGDQGEQPLRPHLIHHTWVNKHAIRAGQWKYLDHPGSGGNDYDQKGRWGAASIKQVEDQIEAPGQLYNLKQDPGETTNLYYKQSEIRKRLDARLDELLEKGRTAPRRN